MRPSKDWLVTDTHFNHDRLVTEGWRPSGFETRIKAAWRRLVAEQDVVYHLGDVILGRQAELKDLLDALPGTKVLVKGNHDHESTGWYMRHGFAFACSGLLHKGVWLTHAPQARLPDGAVLNVHGHLHDRADRRGYPALPHQNLLALELVGYAPVPFDEFCGLSAEATALLAQGRRAQGARAQGRKGARAQGRRAQGRKGARAQGGKIEGAQKGALTNDRRQGNKQAERCGVKETEQELREKRLRSVIFALMRAVEAADLSAANNACRRAHVFHCARIVEQREPAVAQKAAERVVACLGWAE